MKFSVRNNTDFLKAVSSLVQVEYTFIEEYINTKEKIKVIHNTCGNIYYVSPNKFLCGRRCPKCSAKNRALKHLKTTDKFKEDIKRLVGSEYDILSEYTGYENSISIRHNKCNTTYNVTPHKFISGDRCRKCAMKKIGYDKRITNDVWDARFKSVTNGEYSYIGNYIKHSIPMQILHHKCNNTFMMTPHNLYNNGTRCPFCYRVAPSNSKKVIFIESILKKYNISYKKEFRFKDCRDKRPLPFDIYLDELNLLIEYDGEYHFKTSKMHDTEKLKLYISRDNIKNKFCIDKKIPLLRIPFTVPISEIETVVTHFIKFNDQSKDVHYKQMIVEMGCTLIE